MVWGLGRNKGEKNRHTSQPPIAIMHCRRRGIVVVIAVVLVSVLGGGIAAALPSTSSAATPTTPMTFRNAYRYVPGKTIFATDAVHGSLVLYADRLCFEPTDSANKKDAMCFAGEDFTSGTLVAQQGGFWTTYSGLTIHHRQSQTKVVFVTIYGEILQRHIHRCFGIPFFVSPDSTWDQR